MNDEQRRQMHDSLDEADYYLSSPEHRRRVSEIFWKRHYLTGLILIILFGSFGFWLYNSAKPKPPQTWNKFTPGQTMYASDSAFSDKTAYKIELYTMLRPVNADDINEMNIPAWRKHKLIEESKSDLANYKPYVRISNFEINKDSLFKYATSAIGEFVAKDSLPVSEFSYRIAPNADNDYVYLIKLNKKFAPIIKQFLSQDKYLNPIDSSIVRANDNIYIKATTVSPVRDNKFGTD